MRRSRRLRLVLRWNGFHLGSIRSWFLILVIVRCLHYETTGHLWLGRLTLSRGGGSFFRDLDGSANRDRLWIIFSSIFCTIIRCITRDKGVLSKVINLFLAMLNLIILGSPNILSAP